MADDSNTNTFQDGDEVKEQQQHSPPPSTQEHPHQPPDTILGEHTHSPPPHHHQDNGHAEDLTVGTSSGQQGDEAGTILDIHHDPNAIVDQATHDYHAGQHTQVGEDVGGDEQQQQQQQHYAPHEHGAEASEQQQDIYHQDHQQYHDQQQHDTHHQDPSHQHHLGQGPEDGLVDGQEGDHHQQDVGQVGDAHVAHDDENRPANPFDFLPFYPDAAGDMTRLAEAWQQSQQQLQAQAAAAAAAAAAATSHQHGGHQQLDENGNLLESGVVGDDQQAAMEQYTGEHDGHVDHQGKVEQGVDAGDAGLLLGMAAESNSQAVAQQQQVQNAIAAYSAGTPNGTYSTSGSYDSPNPARDAAAAAAAAAAASSGVNPAYAIAAALAAQSQRNGQGWDYAQLTSHLNAAAAANPYSNPNYQNDIAAYNQQQGADGGTSTSDQPMPKPKVRGSRAPGTVPNTIGGHTHRPGSGHAFCSGPVVEGTTIKRFVFPCPPTVSAGRQKHVQSAQEMADTYPLAEHPCDRCTGYDNPLPCFHLAGNKCVYCKFLSKPCSLQPGGSNSKGLRRPDEGDVDKPKKKRKTDAEGYVEGGDIDGSAARGSSGEVAATGEEGNGEVADASAYLEEHHHHQQEMEDGQGVPHPQQFEGGEDQDHQPTHDNQQLGQEGHHHSQHLIQEDYTGQEHAHDHEQQQDVPEAEEQAARELAAVATAQQQHEEELQAQAAQAIQQAQAQAEAMEQAESELQQQQQHLDAHGYEQQEAQHQLYDNEHKHQQAGNLKTHVLLDENPEQDQMVQDAPNGEHVQTGAVQQE